MWPVFKLAARAAAWRGTPEPPLVGLPTLLGWTVVLAAIRIALQFLAAGAVPTFNPYGLNAVVAWLAFELAVAALFVRPAGRATALSAMLVLSIMAEVVIAAIKIGSARFAPACRGERVVDQRGRAECDVRDRRRCGGSAPCSPCFAASSRSRALA